MRETIERNPLGERFRHSIADRPLHVGHRKRIERSHEVVERHPRLWLFGNVLIEKPPPAPSTAVVSKVVSHELAAVGAIAVQSMELPVPIMNGGIEGTGNDQRAE